jgi:hypothetical protein
MNSTTISASEVMLSEPDFFNCDLPLGPSGAVAVPYFCEGVLASPVDDGEDEEDWDEDEDDDEEDDDWDDDEDDDEYDEDEDFDDEDEDWDDDEEDEDDSDDEVV